MKASHPFNLLNDLASIVLVTHGAHLANNELKMRMMRELWAGLVFGSCLGSSALKRLHSNILFVFILIFYIYLNKITRSQKT